MYDRKKSLKGASAFRGPEGTFLAVGDIPCYFDEKTRSVPLRGRSVLPLREGVSPPHNLGRAYSGRSSTVREAKIWFLPFSLAW